MKHTHQRIAELCTATAELLRRDGARTTATCSDWALGASGSQPEEGRTSTGAHSDPTLAAAMARPDRETQLARRWRPALTTMIALGYQVDRTIPSNVTPNNAAEAAKALADHIGGVRSRTTSAGLERAYRVCNEIQHVIYETAPINEEQRREAQIEHDHVERTRRGPLDNIDCPACETPCAPGTTRHGLCHADDALRTRLVDKGEYEGDQWFYNHVKQRINNPDSKQRLDRPGSPLQNAGEAA